jgi:ABC-2 type transport system ATP-binding protein
MKQKLALICTLIHRPKMLLLDEPTTGLDPIVRRDFWNLIKNISGKTTVLVSTAYLNEANFCDRVAFIYKGKLVACDTPVSLKKEGDLEEVFRKLILKKS